MMKGSPEIRVLADAVALARAGVDLFIEVVVAAVAAQGRAAVALSGGSTPKAMFELLARDAGLRARVAWGKVHFFWGDERHVPPNDAESNYRMAREALLAQLAMPEGNVHRILAENADAEKAAEAYASELRRFFGLGLGEFPRFDLIFLGMGPDGHTASLFPNTAALKERTRLVVANRVEKFHTDRITFTVPVINNAASVVFLVAGEEKAEALKAVLEGPRQPEEYPSQLIQPEDGRLIWLVDRAAAKLLSVVGSN